MSSITIDRNQPRQYACDGRRYYSVTQICQAMTGEAFYGSEADMQRGTDLHIIFALAVASYAGRCAPPWVPPGDHGYHGYYQSMQAWISAFKPEPVYLETPSVSAVKGMPFAGTPDLLAWIHYRGRRQLALIDLKSGQPATWHAAQVMAYSKLALYRAAETVGLLYIQADGSPSVYKSVTRNQRDWAAFQAALSLLIWRE